MNSRRLMSSTGSCCLGAPGGFTLPHIFSLTATAAEMEAGVVGRE